MHASLMMYLRPETAAAHDVFWALLRARFAARGIATPAEMSNAVPAMEVWRDPDLVISQTCGLPYRVHLQGRVRMTGTPDYGLEGCQPGYYRSAVVVRAEDPRATMDAFRDARLAVNSTGSQSGFAALHTHVQPLGWWFEDMVISGGHVASAQMVAQGRADIAALDAVTWRMIEDYDSWSRGLRVLEWTVPTPGLPYICGPHVDADAAFEAVAEAIAALPAEARAVLGIKGIVRIPEAAYLAVPTPEASRALG